MNKRTADRLRRTWESLKVYLFCLIGVGVVLILDGVQDGIRGIVLYVPNITEIVVALVVAYVAVILDEGIGGDDVKSREVWIRKRKHAFLTGIAAISLISKVLGG